MLPHSGSRLAVVGLMLVLQSLIFVLELQIFSRHMRRQLWYRPLRQVVGPFLMATLAAILIPVTFANASRYIDGAAEQCNATVDGDIAGQGAQIAVWAQVGVLLVISVLGSFHKSATGAKEAGAGLVLTHVSLSIALLVQMRLGTLSSADAIVGSMILDAQNAGLSIQLAAKETLASRWQVHIVVLAQTLGIIVIPVLVSNFTHGAFATDDCQCLTVFWWSWLSSCGSMDVGEEPVFWTYYTCRCIGLLQTSFHSLYNTLEFDRTEKSERTLSDSGNQASDADAVDEEQQLSTSLLRETEEQGNPSARTHLSRLLNDMRRKRSKKGKYTNRGDYLRHVTHPYHRSNGQVASFGEYPATVTLMYIVYGAFSLTSMSTVQTTVVNFNLKSPSPIASVGQIISLSVAAATFGRAAWLLFILFRDEARRNKASFVWPFNWHFNPDRLLAFIKRNEHYVMCSPPSQDSGRLTLGAMLTDPFDPNSLIMAKYPVPESEESPSESLEGTSTFGVSTAWTIGDTTNRAKTCKWIYNDWHTTDQRDIRSFEPSKPTFTDDLHCWLQNQAHEFEKDQSLYLVTGIKLAKDLVTHEHPSTALEVKNEIWRLPEALWTRLALRLALWALMRSPSRAFHYPSEGESLLAYRLHIVQWSRIKKEYGLYGVYRPEEDW